MATNIREDAVSYAATVIKRSTDWQQVLDALSNHHRFGPWLHSFGDDGLAEGQAIVREAEESLGVDIPDNYSN